MHAVVDGVQGWPTSCYQWIGSLLLTTCLTPWDLRSDPLLNKALTPDQPRDYFGQRPKVSEVSLTPCGPRTPDPAVAAQAMLVTETFAGSRRR